MHLQLEFFKRFFHNPNIDLYFELRNYKYNTLNNIIPLFIIVSSYFSHWLAGFIESKGCFTNLSSGTSSFSIAQNSDYYLMEAIRSFYGINHLTIYKKIIKVNGYPLYELSITSLVGVTRVANHCIPLLQGYKYYRVIEFINKSKRLQDQIKLNYKIRVFLYLIYVSCCQTTMRKMSTFLGVFYVKDANGEV